MGHADDWADAARLAANARLLRARYQRTIRACEARHGLPSDRLEEALRAGTLRETAEVCAWLIALRASRKLATT